MSQTSNKSHSLLEKRQHWLDRYQTQVRYSEQGKVVSIGDGIVWISGLPSAAIDDLLILEDNCHAMVFDLTQKLIGAVLLRSSDKLRAGSTVSSSGRRLSIGVSDELLGRVVDPLGEILDDGGPIQHARFTPLETASPPIIERDFVNRPFYTGNKIIDSMIPLGRGQRQLILGDDGLGRSSIAIDAVIHQKDQNMRCVYVLIGQKRSSVLNTINTLRQYDALSYTTVVVAEANSLPGLQQLAPFAGCAIAESWMRQGHDTLVVYDDLSTHAKIYRELSLLVRRPPGREAYPGDIFSLHARLLERATCLNTANGAGSMTALPILETQQGEISAYIPTNLISITDGQIYLERKLFAAGIRPAIDIGRSVSRIGGAAQHAMIKSETRRMKLDYLQFLELEVFTRFGARLEKSMERAIKRGQILREILKQERLQPLAIRLQLAWLIAFNDGLFDQADIEQVEEWLAKLIERSQHSQLDLHHARESWSEFVKSAMPTAGVTKHDEMESSDPHD